MSGLVYFSSSSENTHRFVQRLGMPAQRIPLATGERLAVFQPFILLVPTWGNGGVAGAVPSQVIRFLNVPRHRQLIRGVIASGNRNFGAAYALAGSIIAKKCQVPFLYRFELMGTPEDIDYVRHGVTEFWQRQQPDNEPT